MTTKHKNSLLLTLTFLLFAIFSYGQTIVDPVFSKSTNLSYKVYIDSSSLDYCLCSELKILPLGVADACNWKLFTPDKKIKKCGCFEKGKLTNGLTFFYSPDGRLTKIKKFYKGREIGECIIENDTIKNTANH